MSYNERIKKFRTDRKMTHQQFADAVGVTRGSVQQWESGATAPKRPNQPAVAKFMGITVSELMNDDEISPPLPSPLPHTEQKQPLSIESISPSATRNVAPTLENALLLLGAWAANADDLVRDQVRPLVNRIFDEPQRTNEIVARIVATLQAEITSLDGPNLTPEDKRRAARVTQAAKTAASFQLPSKTNVKT